VPLFLRKLVLGIRAQASGKNYAAAIAFGAPIRPASPAPTQQGIGASLRNDFTPCRDALQVCFASLCKSARRYGFRRLKNLRFALLRFQDFQRKSMVTPIEDRLKIYKRASQPAQAAKS